MKINQLLQPGWKGNFFALLSGAMLTLTFAPFFISPLAIVSPAILLALWLTLTPKQAFVRGLFFGIGFFGTGVYWVFISIHNYGNASILLAGAITCLFILLLALFPALNGYFLNRYFPRLTDPKMIYTFPAIWILLEWIRSWIFTGFPWLLLGESQLYTPLKGYAPIFSVYGVSLMVLISSGLLVSSFIHFKKSKAFFLIAIWIVGAGLSYINWTKPEGKPIQVSLIQGNVEQGIKWSYDQLQPTLDLYHTLSADHWDSKIIVWPENAVPLSLQNAMNYIDAVGDEAKRHQSTVILGIPIQNQNENNYFNAVIAIGNNYSFYLKRQLVPFGEYTPFQPYLESFMNHFNIPMSSIIRSNQPLQPLSVQGLQIAAFVCYEIAFPELVQQYKKDVSMLLTVSNDGWFGHSIASAQHMAIAQMRAIELARPVLFVSNTGLTSIIKPNGKIQSQISPFETAVLTDKVQPMTGETLWQKRGMDSVLLIIISFLIISIKSQREAKKKDGRKL